MRLSLVAACSALFLGVLAANAFTYDAVGSHAERGQLHQSMRESPLKHFESWVALHAKSYASDAVEMARRLAIWTENLEYIISYNSQHTSHWLGLNNLADLTHEEYRKHLGYDHAAKKDRLRLKTKGGNTGSFKYADLDEATLPPSIDWRTNGAVTEVKNQAQCGSCWAFSTTGSIEGINAIVSGSLVSLSEQELVDCDKEQDNGCSGGLMDNAYDFIIKNGGIDTETDYPYTAQDSVCIEPKANRHIVTIDGFEDVPANDESALHKAVANQPVSVAIEADQKSFQLYMGGVYSDKDCGEELDHGVLVVGYGKDPKEGRYWIIKNSWSAQWGDKGYIRIKAGFDKPEGLCGIAMAASYPTKTSSNPDPTPDPPPPEPEPTPGPSPGPSPTPSGIACDDSASCPDGTTCCCLSEIFNVCLQWGCCPMPEATCCKDKQHCCPKSAPICHLEMGRCGVDAHTMIGSVPWSTKVPATKTYNSIFDRIFHKKATTSTAEQRK